MLQTGKRTFLWFMGGILSGLLVLLVVCGGLAGNVTVADPDGIPEAADAVMNSIHSGDWDALQKKVSGYPSLTPVTGETDSAEELIYDAYLKSLQWTCHDGFSIQGTHITQDLTLTCLDIRSVTDAMTVILAETNISAVSPEEQSQLLLSAAKQVLEAESPTIQRHITLSFLRQQGQWLLVPNSALQALLSGFTPH